MLLYIHIPFCDSKCHYCSFNSFTKNHHLKKDYIKALLKQLNFEFERFKVNKNIESVFIGGGTPSVLDVKYYEEIFKIVSPHFKDNIEITIEANPNSATYEWLKNIKEFGINRVSFGVQSFNDKKLKFLGRSHNSKDALKAINNAQKSGFENISIDIIYDTALDNKELLKKDIDLALSLPINHISAYSLTIEENTLFENKKDVKKSDENIGYFLKKIIPFEQYEVSNFGKYKCFHNIGYWKLKDYIGVGAGAVGFLKNKRFYPKNDLFEYIKDPLDIKVENLTQKEITVEKIFLGFRSFIGVDKKILNKDMEKRAKILIKENKLYEKNGKIYNKNFFLADEISLFILG